jgi:hypothetical protein
VNALATIAASAADRNLPFLLAGGHAVIAHGHVRNTFDLDLIIPRDDRDNWISLAAAIGYSLYREGPTFLQFNPADSKVLPLDLMLVSQDTFGKMAAEAVPAPVGSGGAKVVSLRHLLALKCHAIKHGHSGRIVKDADDVLGLALANRLDLNDPEIRDLFLKHGTVELYEKARRACSPT